MYFKLPVYLCTYVGYILGQPSTSSKDEENIDIDEGERRNETNRVDIIRDNGEKLTNPTSSSSSHNNIDGDHYMMPGGSKETSSATGNITVLKKMIIFFTHLIVVPNKITSS